MKRPKCQVASSQRVQHATLPKHWARVPAPGIKELAPTPDISTSSRLQGPSLKSRRDLVLRPCGRAKGEAGRCLVLGCSRPIRTCIPLEMIGAESKVCTRCQVQMSTSVRRFDTRSELAFSFARSESYSSVRAVSICQMVPGKWQAVSLFIVGNGNGLDILVDRTRRLEEEILS
jgi:hypothetical protein